MSQKTQIHEFYRPKERRKQTVRITDERGKNADCDIGIVKSYNDDMELPHKNSYRSKKMSLS